MSSPKPSIHSHADHGSSPWRHILCHRPSAGWPMDSAFLEQELSSALQEGFDINAPELCHRLVGPSSKSLLGMVMMAHAGHLDPPRTLELIALLARHGASFVDPDPLEVLVLHCDHEDTMWSIVPVLQALLDHGANPLAMEASRGEGWAIGRLEGEGMDDAVQFLADRLPALRQQATLDATTPQRAPRAASPRF